jgi:hypothetical protein
MPSPNVELKGCVVQTIEWISDKLRCDHNKEWGFDLTKVKSVELDFQTPSKYLDFTLMCSILKKIWNKPGVADNGDEKKNAASVKTGVSGRLYSTVARSRPRNKVAAGLRK